MRISLKSFVSRGSVVALALVLAVLSWQALPLAQTVGGEIFLQGDYVEVGIHAAGSFGTANCAPAGFHSLGAACKLGFVVDPGQDGWTVGRPAQSGDYFLPGQPEEGWSVEWTTSTEHTFGNYGRMGSFQIPATSFVETSSGDTRSAVWEGTAVNGTAEKLKITTTIHFKKGDRFFVMSNVLTNVGTATLNSVEFMRNVDPDQEEPLTNSFATRNWVENSGDQKLVIAKGVTYGLTLGLGTIDSRAVVSTEGFSNRDPDAILNTPVTPTAAAPRYADEAIALAYRFGTLAPGQSVSFDYAYILNADDLVPALQSLAEVSIVQPTGTASGSSVEFQATTTDVPNTQRVDFYINDTLVGSDTAADSGGVFATTFDSTSYPNGTLNLKVVATYLSGRTAEKTSTVSVDNSGPPVSFLIPVAGQMLNGTAIPVQLTIDPSHPPTSVSFFRETSSSLFLGQDTTEPFTTVFSVSDLPAGQTVTIKAVATDALNRATTIQVSGTVGKLDQTITFAPIADTTYGAAALTLTPTASSGLAVTLSASGNCTLIGAQLELTGAGTCSVTASQAGDESYNPASSITRTFVIAKATATLTISAPPATYDGIAHGATVTTLPATLASGVTITYDGTTAAPVAAGTYAVQATLDDANYQATPASASLTIAPAAAVVTAPAAGKVYGDADPVLNGTLSGFLASDGVTATFSREPGEAVGAYAITASLAPSPVLANYAIEYHVGAFTIEKRQASVTPAAATKIYGSADPVLTGTLTGFLPADGVSATYSRVAGESVVGGPYTISATLTGALGNYDVTSGTAALTIVPAPLTVTAGAYTRDFGAPDPAFAVTYAGFVNGETPAVLDGALTFATTATPASGLGVYPVVPGGVASPNYAMAFVPGTLTIVDASAPVVIVPASLTTPALRSSGAPVTFAVSAQDLVDGAVATTCSPASGSTFAIGTTTVTCLAADRSGNTGMATFVVKVTNEPTAGFMHGAGHVDLNGLRHSVNFTMLELPNGYDLGSLWITACQWRPGDHRDRDDDDDDENGCRGDDDRRRILSQRSTFIAKTFTFVRFSDDPAFVPGRSRWEASIADTVVMAGTGWWNGRNGYTFEIVATDRGEPGRGRDTFDIVVKASDGTVVLRVPEVAISNGNIQAGLFSDSEGRSHQPDRDDDDDRGRNDDRGNDDHDHGDDHGHGGN